MAHNLIHGRTRIENELIWKINLCSIGYNCGATYIAKSTDQQSNTDAIPSIQESKILNHILTSISTSVLSYKQEISYLKLHFLFSLLQQCN